MRIQEYIYVTEMSAREIHSQIFRKLVKSNLRSYLRGYT